MEHSVFGQAKWIGALMRNLHAHTMSAFQLSCTIRIAPGSTCAGLLFGGNDSRLMDKNKNLQGVEAEQNESCVNLCLDIAPLLIGKPAIFSACRFGYAPGDDRQPLHTAEIPQDVLHTGNCHEPLTIRVKCVYGQIEVRLDDHLLTKQSFGEDVWNLNPIGAGNNYICFPLLCDVGVKLEPGQRAVSSKRACGSTRWAPRRRWKPGCWSCGSWLGSTGSMPPGFPMSSPADSGSVQALPGRWR